MGKLFSTQIRSLVGRERFSPSHSLSSSILIALQLGPFYDTTIFRECLSNFKSLSTFEMSELLLVAIGLVFRC